jgi:hypothetical protein
MSNRPHGREDPRGYGQSRDRDEARPRGSEVSIDYHHLSLFIAFRPTRADTYSRLNFDSTIEEDVRHPAPIDLDLMDLVAAHLLHDASNVTPETYAISPNPIHGEVILDLDLDLDGIIVDGIVEMNILETIAHHGKDLYAGRRPLHTLETIAHHGMDHYAGHRPLHTLERIARRGVHAHSPHRIRQPLDYLPYLDLDIRDGIPVDHLIRTGLADLDHQQ